MVDGVQKRPVHVRRVPSVVETVDEFFAKLGDAVVIRVGETPESRRRAHVEGAIKPACTLGERELVRKHCALFKKTVTIGILEHEHAVGRVCLELGFIPIHADCIANEKPAGLVQTCHNRVVHEGMLGDSRQVVAIRDDGVWRRCFLLLDLLGFESDNGRSFGSLRDHVSRLC